MLILDDDDELTEEVSAAEAAFAAKLGVDGLAAIDERLVAQVSRRLWKVARIVSFAIREGGLDSWEDGCVELHVRRVTALVASGRMEGQGNIRRPRFSEVRLPESAGS